MQDITAIFPLLNTPKKVVITTHQKPDGDAMGSTLGLYHLLTALNHTVQVISPTNWASFLNWMPGAEHVLDYEKNVGKCDECIETADWIFCLDFNTLSRTKSMEPSLMASKAERILIDHHR
jgi:phosphoesterase RecJ-like protein